MVKVTTTNQQPQKSWTDINFVDPKIGMKVRLEKRTMTDEQEKALNYTYQSMGGRKHGGYGERCDILEHEIFSAFFNPLNYDIDYDAEATVLELTTGEDIRYQQTSIHLIWMLCKLRSGDDEHEKIPFLDVRTMKRLTLENDEEDDEELFTTLDALPSIGKAFSRKAKVFKKHVVFADGDPRRKVDIAFNKFWKKLRDIGYDFDTSVAFHDNQYATESTQETLLPMINYVKRSLNVYAKSFIMSCSPQIKYHDDEVWKDGANGTEAYSDNHISFVGSKKPLNEKEKEPQQVYFD